MNDKETNINDEILEIKKNILKENENEIMKSQINQNKLEDEIRKLEIKKDNIITGNKWILRNIISYKIYDAIMVSILLLFVTYFVNKFELIISTPKAIHVIGLALGVVTISAIGVFVSEKILEKLKSYYRKKRITKISRRIKKKEFVLAQEINKQEKLKRDITNTMNRLDSNLDITVIERKQDEINYTGENAVNICNEVEKYNVKKRIKK